MRERTSSKIRISRPRQGGDLVLMDAPITAQSVRVFSLMQEDYIQLNFSLPQAVHFAIGDYADDDIFGTFYLIADSMPNYNTSTGGYDYALKFEAGYRRWKNFLFMLTTDASGQRVRKETQWTLTAKLETHAQEVVHNLETIGLRNVNLLESYAIDITAEKASEVHNLTYSGTDIISALNSMASAWECEWWVTTEEVEQDGSRRLLYTIHFGKCEHGDEPIVFSLATNVEKMSVNRDSNTYTNKIFAFGSTRNIPQTYDQDLVFTANHTEVVDNITLYEDSTRPLRLDWVLTDMSGSTTHIGGDTAFTYEGTDGAGINITYQARSTHFNGLASVSEVQGEIPIIFALNGTTRIVLKVVLYEVQSNGDKATDLMEETYEAQSLQETIVVDTPIDASTEKEWYIKVTATYENAETPSYASMVVLSTAASFDLNLVAAGGTKNAVLKVWGEEEEYNVTFNAAQEGTGVKKRMFAFTGQVPPGFSVGDNGTKYTLSPLSVSVPTSYYTPRYQSGSVLNKIGERRLHMPESGNTADGSVKKEGLQTMDTVESVVIFEKVFPRLALRITSVRAEERKEKEEYSDQSSRMLDYTEYYLQVEQVDGTPFNFVLDYMIDGEPLQLSFLSDTEYQEVCETKGLDYTSLRPQDGFKLAGMTFEAKLSGNTYLLLRNETYGAKLPDKYLKPSVGDPLVVIGWNPKAMANLGLIEAAQDELKARAQEYLSALTEGNFTFQCDMMSNWMFSIENNAFLTKENEELICANGDKLYVANGMEVYSLLTEGQKITVEHDALAAPKTSRIIGYRYKLDKPYDTPQYTVGDTEAYSRLKQIEKEITKISR